MIAFLEPHRVRGSRPGFCGDWWRAQISGDVYMRNMIKIVALLALLGTRGATAQTVGTARSPAGSPTTATAPPSLTSRLTGSAPIGHRQLQARDVPSQNSGDLERLTEEDAAIDRKLIICRGC